MMSRLASSTLFGCLLGPACVSSHVAPPPAPPIYEPRQLDGVGSDLKAMPSRLWHDTKLAFGDSGSLLVLAGAVGYSFAHENYWEDQEAVFFKNHTLFGRTIQEGLGAMGNGLTLYAGALAWYFTALIQDDYESYEASKTLLSALTVTSFVTLLAKGTVRDGRPNGGSHDFPSGHASLSMATASVLDGLYGHTIGYPAYGLAVLVGLQRLDTLKHDTGSVVMGMALGWVIGHTLATDRAPKIFGLHLGLALDPEIGGVGLSLSGGR